MEVHPVRVQRVEESSFENTSPVVLDGPRLSFFVHDFGLTREANFPSLMDPGAGNLVIGSRQLPPEVSKSPRKIKIDLIHPVRISWFPPICTFMAGNRNVLFRKLMILLSLCKKQKIK